MSRISKIDWGYYKWMVRVVDAPKALTERGYPAGLDGELHIEFRDDLLPSNDGRFVATDYIDGSDRELATATTIFGGSAPWLADFF